MTLSAPSERVRLELDEEFGLVALWINDRLELGALRRDGDVWIQWSTEPIA